ncbi:hypothetical protein KW799_02635, partial [Candidatus Parcubacteria bacterium]|nr:hypothetical protein [Candidatus Parcubacteria bacterium]
CLKMFFSSWRQIAKPMKKLFDNVSAAELFHIPKTSRRKTAGREIRAPMTIFAMRQIFFSSPRPITSSGPPDPHTAGWR